MCAVIKGDPPFEIFWHLNGRKVESNDGILITRSGQKMSMLYIESVQPRHAGIFECVVKSVTGLVRHSSTLKVNGLCWLSLECLFVFRNFSFHLNFTFPNHRCIVFCCTILPQISPFEFGDPVDASSVTTVNCAVIRGDPPFEITWKLNGRRIDSNDGITITRTGQRMSVLYIESVQPRHSGSYTCSVKGIAGIFEHLSVLRVNGSFL